MTNRVTNFTNGAETSLSVSISAADTTLSVGATSQFPGVDFYVVIDPDVDAKREVVLVTGKTGSSFTVTRGQDGTSATTHDANAVVAHVPTAAMFTDLHDRVTGHTHTGGEDGTAIATADLTGHDKAAHDALNINADTVDAFEASELTPVGAIQMFGGASAPSKWLMCDGSAVSRATYADLFSTVGTTFGAGDGSTTFNLPDLRDNFPVGAGSTYSRGDTGGEATHALTSSEMPAHTHTGPSHSHGSGTLATGNDAHSHIVKPDDDAAQVDVDSTGLGSHDHDTFSTRDLSAAPTPQDGSGTFQLETNSDTHNHTVTGSTAAAGTGNTGSAGSGDAHENRPPYLALNFIIFAGA